MAFVASRSQGEWVYRTEVDLLVERVSLESFSDA